MRSALPRVLAKALLTPWRFAFSVLSFFLCMCSTFAFLVSLLGADARVRDEEGVAGGAIWSLERAPLSKLDLLQEVPGNLPEAVVRSLERSGIQAWFVLARNATIADADRSFSLEATVSVIPGAVTTCWLGHLPSSAEGRGLRSVWLAEVLYCPRGPLPTTWQVMNRLQADGLQLLMSSDRADTWWARDWRLDVRRIYFAPVDATALTQLKSLSCCVTRQVTLNGPGAARSASTTLTAALLGTLALLAGLVVNGQRELIRLEASLKRTAGLRWRSIASSVMLESLAVALLPWLVGAVGCAALALLYGDGASLRTLATLLVQSSAVTAAGSLIWAVVLLARYRRQAVFGLMKS